jgi:hypothetical protein
VVEAARVNTLNCMTCIDVSWLKNREHKFNGKKAVFILLMKLTPANARTKLKRREEIHRRLFLRDFF